ncbi:hypothetical protein [Gimesia panareensis]|uniref:hypothetical protein n=1 Tax=Gimesia panareensis TaxID=2527978 RepID=UPI0011886F22|nr:hypothetical protein [Gimesia panareensis]QDU51058.1 hypothetical protein Pan110_34190 [Gimesia panareensis]
MKRLFPTLAICLATMVMVSEKSNAAEFSNASLTTPVQTAYSQPQPGSRVMDVLTFPFRAIAAPFRTQPQRVAYQPYYGQASYGTSSCPNGQCYTGTGYSSSCTTGNCGTGYGSCSGGSCGMGAGSCPGGNCGVSQYRYPSQSYPSYGNSNWNVRPQYRTYRPVSQPVYRSSVPVSTNSMRNDPFFP